VPAPPDVALPEPYTWAGPPVSVWGGRPPRCPGRSLHPGTANHTTCVRAIGSEVAAAAGGTMPLSEHEQRLLEQMERALSAEDPRLASAMRGSAAARRRHRTMLTSVAGFVLGLALLMAGVVDARLVLVSVAGFVLMLVCAVAAVNGWRSRGPDLFVIDPQVPGGRRVGAASRQRGGRPTQGRPAGASRPDHAERPRRPATGSFMDRMEGRWKRRRQDRGL